MKKTIVRTLAVSAVSAACMVAISQPAAADTYPANKVEKAVFFSSIGLSSTIASTACYTVTFSDRYRNWAMVELNRDEQVNTHKCVAFDGVVFYKRSTPNDQWEWIDSGDKDLLVGVPEQVEKEFLSPKR